MAQLEWDGERFLPEMEGAQIHYEHLHRYAWATSLVEGQVVLDLACGEGYGAYMLAQTAKQVVGVDLNEEVIRHASSKYIRGNLRFLQGAMEEIPLEGQALFDVIVCFEAIEHTDQQDRVFAEIKRLLKPEGRLIISTPNKYLYTDQTQAVNPFHKREFYLADFQQCLQEHFRYVALWGQRIYMGSCIWALSDQRAVCPQEFVIERGGEGKEFVFVEPQRKVPLYFIAIASDAPLPTPPAQSWLIDISDQLKGYYEDRLQQLTQDVTYRDQVIAEKDREIQKLYNLKVVRLLRTLKRLVRK